MAQQTNGGATAIGLAVVLGGLIAGAALYVVSLGRPSDAVAEFARAPVGCTTTLDFVEPGRFFVYEETGGLLGEIPAGCTPVADAGTPFQVEFTGSRQPAIDAGGATGPSYEVDGVVGRAIRTLEITEPGEYLIEVAGPDLAMVAAVGGDPQDGVTRLRVAALVTALLGMVVGLALLGRSRRRAPGATVPADTAVWGPPTSAASPSAPPTSGPATRWPPAVPSVDPPVTGAEWPPRSPNIAEMSDSSGALGSTESAEDGASWRRPDDEPHD